MRTLLIASLSTLVLLGACSTVEPATAANSTPATSAVTPQPQPVAGPVRAYSLTEEQATVVFQYLAQSPAPANTVTGIMQSLQQQFAAAHPKAADSAKK